MANKETAAKEKEEKQKQAVEDREKRRHQSGTDPWGQETIRNRVVLLRPERPTNVPRKGGDPLQTSPYSVFF